MTEENKKEIVEAPTKKTAVEMFYELQAKATVEAKKAAKQVVAEIKSASEKIKVELDKRTKLSDEDRKFLLTADQESLQYRVTNELIETRTSMILIDRAIAITQSKIMQLSMAVHAPKSVDEMVCQARIAAESSDLQKLFIQKMYLETIFVELSKTAVIVNNARTMERFKPVASHLKSLLNEVDRVQAESDYLSKTSTDPVVIEGRKVLKEGKEIIGDSNAF